MTDYAPLTATSGNISPKCSSLMSHRIRQADVARFQAALMDGLMPPSLPHPRRMVPRLSLLLYSVVGAVALLPMRMTWEITLISLLLTLGMCLISAVLAVRRVIAADPAEVF
jgi:hypothetical protein